MTDPRIRPALQGACLVLFFLALYLARHYGNPLCLGVLVAVPPLASLAWPAMTALVVSASAYAAFGLALIFGMEYRHAPGLQLGIIALAAVSARLLYRDSGDEMLAQHSERQALEDIQDEIIQLDQEVKETEDALEQGSNRQTQYALLSEAAQLLGSSLDLGELADIVLEQTTRLLAKPACFTLFLFDRAGKEIMRRQVDTGAGLTFPAGTDPQADKLNSWALSLGTPLMIRNLAKDFRFKGLDISAIRSKCFLISPLVMGNKTSGLMRIESPGDDVFDTEDQRLLETLMGLSILALENAKLYREAQELSVTDGLTGLLLRRTLLEKLEEELRRSAKSGPPTAFILLDLDHFKDVNDRFGHPAGDQVLKEVSGLVKGSVRDLDRCGRYGGEEFAVILSSTDLPGARVVAERMRQSVAAHSFRLGEGQLGLTVSLGIAVYPGDANSLEQLIERADQALYHSKQTGRNRVSVYAEIPGEGVKS